MSAADAASRAKRALGAVLGGQGYRLAHHAWHFCVNPEHRAYLRRRAKALRFYAQFVRPGALCFDVGANHGDRTATFLRLGARVVAVEPNPECAADIERKFGNHLRFSLVRSALGEREGEATLFLGEFDAVSSLSSAWVADAKRVPTLAGAVWSRTIATNVTTLDRLVERFGVPRFCKIDVEGYEFEVLKGVSRALPALSFEYTPWRIAPALACIARLEELDPRYRFNFSRGDSFALAAPTWCSGTDMLQHLRDEAAANAELFGDVYARAPDPQRANQ